MSEQTGTSQVFKEQINAPLVFEVCLPETVPSRGTGVVVLPNDTRNMDRNNPVFWDQKRIHEALMLVRAQGFMPGAVVAKKQLPGSGADWKVTSHFYWGIVISHNQYIPGEHYEGGYAPINVKWLVKDNHSGHAEERMFPGQLYLIHGALTEQTIRDKMRAQV